MIVRGINKSLSVAINFVTTEDVKMLREIETF
jgi:hypothetical protein